MGPDKYENMWNRLSGYQQLAMIFSGTGMATAGSFGSGAEREQRSKKQVRFLKVRAKTKRRRRRERNRNWVAAGGEHPSVRKAA